MPNLTITLTDDLYARLDKACKYDKRTKSNFIAVATSDRCDAIIQQMRDGNHGN